MSTEQQRKAVQNIIKTGFEGKVNKRKALKEAGYSHSVASKPKIVTESKGFIEAAKEYGLTEENFVVWLVEDIQAKPAERLGELKLAASVLKLDSQNVNLSVQKSDESIDLLEKLIDERTE